jgi:hypothetical protein
LINSLMDPLKKHKKVPFDDWPALLAYLTKIRSVLKEVDRLGVFTLFNTVSNIDAITDKLLDYSNDLLDSQLGATFERFIAQEWKYATSVVSRTTSTESALKAMGVTGGGSGSGGGHHQEDVRGSRSNNKDGKRGNTGDPGPHQVPVGPTQQSGGGQVALKTAFSAARSVTHEKGSDPSEDDHDKENKSPAFHRKNLKCYLQECQADPHHALPDCPRFNSMSVLRRWSIVKDRKICEYCQGHTLSYPCWRAASRQGRPTCEVDRCGGHHHTVLHVPPECTVAPAASQKQVMGARWLVEGWRKPLNKRFRFRAWGEKGSTSLRSASNETSSKPQKEEKPVAGQPRPQFRRPRSSKYSSQMKIGSNKMLAEMSENMSVCAIGEYISEAGSAPEGGEAISKVSPPPFRPCHPM